MTVIKIEKNDLGICVNCATPIVDKKQHYCPKCGNVIGEYTRYLPYENIRFNYSIFGTIVNKLKTRFKKFF
jgi:predicted amidophosphoribosyltransferase